MDTRTTHRTFGDLCLKIKVSCSEIMSYPLEHVHDDDFPNMDLKLIFKKINSVKFFFSISFVDK